MREGYLTQKKPRFHLRRKDKEITDINQIGKIIKKATVCRLGLVDNGEPYVVPVNFGFEGNAIYFHSALEGRKIEIIRKNSKVCFEIDTGVGIGKSEKSNCAVKYRSVIGTGRIHILEGDEEKIHGLKAIMRQCAGGEYEFSAEKLGTVLVAKVSIEGVTGKQSGY